MTKAVADLCTCAPASSPPHTPQAQRAQKESPPKDTPNPPHTHTKAPLLLFMLLSFFFNLFFSCLSSIFYKIKVYFCVQIYIFLFIFIYFFCLLFSTDSGLSSPLSDPEFDFESQFLCVFVPVSLVVILPHPLPEFSVSLQSHFSVCVHAYVRAYICVCVSFPSLFLFICNLCCFYHLTPMPFVCLVVFQFYNP